MHPNKFIAILAVFLFITTIGFGQDRLLGLRQGVGFWLVKSGKGKGSLQYAPGNHFTWNKELFFRSHQKSWAYEASIMTYERRYSTYKESALETIESHHNNRFLEMNLQVQYDVSYPLAGLLIPALSSMKSYFGFSLIPRLSFDKIHRQIESKTGAISESNHTGESLSMFLGVAYTHIIPLSKKFVLTSNLSFKMQPGTTLPRQESSENRQISLLTGLSYKL